MTVNRAIGGTGNWLDERFRGAKGLRAVFKKLYPDFDVPIGRADCIQFSIDHAGRPERD